MRGILRGVYLHEGLYYSHPRCKQRGIPFIANKAVIALAILILNPLATCAQEVTELYVERPVHLGDNNITDWTEAALTEGIVFNRTFNIQGRMKTANLDMLTFDVNWDDNPIIINNKTIDHVCLNTPQVLWKNRKWNTCNITIPTRYLVKGKNTIQIKSVWKFIVQEYDDIMFSRMRVKVDYNMLQAHMTAAKLVTPQEIMLGETANVTVMLTNIGIRPAYNITAYDDIPPTTESIAGKTNATADVLYEGDAIRYEYQIEPTVIGNFTSWPGEVNYTNDTFTKFTTQIESTKLSVIPPRPLLRVTKKVEPNIVAANTTFYVEVTVSNDKPETAYDVIVKDPIPDSFGIVSGSPNMTEKTIETGRSITFNYTAQPMNIGTFYISPIIQYSDSKGNTYGETAKEANITVTKNNAINANSRVLMIAAMALLIITLVVVYTKIRAGK